MSVKPQRFALPANDPNRQRYLANCIKFLGELPADKSWRVEIGPLAKPRTNDQCAYLNGVVYRVIGEALGFERDDISEYLCGEFFGWRAKELPGNRSVDVPVRTTTTDESGSRSVLPVKRFAEFIDFCQRFAVNHGIFVPDPNEAMEEQAP